MVIYMTINLITKKCYIGKDVKNKKSYLGSGIILKKAIKKHGKENFKKIILEKCSSKEELAEREKYWISFFDAVKSKKFYNVLEGGIGGAAEGHKTGKETKNKIRNSLLNKKRPKEVVEKFYKAVLQYDHEGNFLKEFPNKKSVDEYVNGRVGKIGNYKNPFFSHGFLWVYKKENIPNKIVPNKVYLQVLKVGKFNKNNILLDTYSSLSEAIKINKNDHIRSVCTGKRKTASGFIWKFIN